MQAFVMNAKPILSQAVGMFAYDAPAFGGWAGAQPGYVAPPPDPPAFPGVIFPDILRTGINTSTVTFPEAVIWNGELPLWISPLGPNPRSVVGVTPVSPTEFDIQWDNSVADGAGVEFPQPDDSFVTATGKRVVGQSVFVHT